METGLTNILMGTSEYFIVLVADKGKDREQLFSPSHATLKTKKNVLMIISRLQVFTQERQSRPCWYAGWEMIFATPTPFIPISVKLKDFCKQHGIVFIYPFELEDGEYLHTGKHQLIEKILSLIPFNYKHVQCYIADEETGKIRVVEHDGSVDETLIMNSKAIVGMLRHS